MRLSRIVALTFLALALPVFPASGTTLVRQGLEELTAGNELVVRGRVLDIHSYWNTDHTFILTDVRIRPDAILKGPSQAGEIAFTLLGGTVGEITTLLVAGPDLVPGSEYVLFLKHEGLPGGSRRLTIRDHAQGVFQIENGRAFSQALGHQLLTDVEGLVDVPGGEEGLPLEEMARQVRQFARNR
jgi:hypothetical protein